jgi:regulator of protease activity HflC (stomatin/prohibitin superfamily)
MRAEGMSMQGISKLIGTVVEAAEEGAFDQFKVDARDFASAREGQPSAGTEMEQVEAGMHEASELLNRSKAERGSEGGVTNVISPVVIPKDSRSFKWLLPFGFLFIVGLVGGQVLEGLFGFHFWLLLLAFAGLKLWQNSYVMIPDGCRALITKYGKLEQTVGPGRTWLIDPRKKIGYIVNTTKQYPYNAPIREAPTSGRVNASVDLFLQFQIEDPEHFIFTLGGVNGFAEKLQNAVSELTRSLIYEQKAEAIYDLVGESTEPMLEALNGQFLPAVRFVSANITHAEPSSQEYRMDLAAAEIVRVAKEAYTYQYELQLRKQQDEGELEKELGGLQETLSEIRADIARYQAQIDTAREKEANRANAYARQLMIEAEAEARANAALLEAQALDIRAVNSAEYPEILEHRYRQHVLDSIEAIAEKLPRVIAVGDDESKAIDYVRIARQMLGIGERTLFSDQDVETIRGRVKEISARIAERAAELEALIVPEPEAAGSAPAGEGGAA